MFSANGLLGRNFGIAASAMDGLTMRQRVHAENLANIDTPGYRARTVDFESTLRSAIGSGRNPMGADGARLPNSVSDAATAAGALSTQFTPGERTGDTKVSRIDEVNNMMNDNIRYRVLSQSVTNRISSLKQVIAEMGRG